MDNKKNHTELDLLLRDGIIKRFMRKNRKGESVCIWNVSGLRKNEKHREELVNVLVKALENVTVDKILVPDGEGVIIANSLSSRLKVPVQFSPEMNHREPHEDGDDCNTNSLKIIPGERILFIDDILGKGVLANNTLRLVKEQGGTVVGAAFVLEMNEFDGRNLLTKHIDDNTIVCLYKV